MADSFSKQEKINLAHAEVALADGHADGLDLLVTMFVGFGVPRPHRCASGKEAMEIAGKSEINLFVIDAALSDFGGFDFVYWLRRSKLGQTALAPVILLTGHTRRADIDRARECGANFVVKKPAPPLVLLQRVLWLSRDTRQFVQCETYVGPDRRIRALGPPAGTKGRRHDDLST